MACDKKHRCGSFPNRCFNCMQEDEEDFYISKRVNCGGYKSGTTVTINML